VFGLRRMNVCLIFFIHIWLESGYCFVFFCKWIQKKKLKIAYFSKVTLPPLISLGNFFQFYHIKNFASPNRFFLMLFWSNVQFCDPSLLSSLETNEQSRHFGYPSRSWKLIGMNGTQLTIPMFIKRKNLKIPSNFILLKAYALNADWKTYLNWVSNC